MEKIVKRRRASSSNALIRIENITKRFPGHNAPILDNVSLTIDESDLFVLVGPSGCGKTTLMRMIAGFERPDSGSIYLGDQDITNVPPYERPINMMFQSYALFPHMSVEENVAFGLRQERGISEREMNNRIAEVLNMVNMRDFAKRNPSQLSGGQKQRVALARCLVKRPKILLLDEPLGALDRGTRERTQLELIKIQYLLETTFIMVTHDQEEAMSMADKMAVLNCGHVLQIGTPEEIYESPNSRFIAEFVDSINLFEAKVLTKQNRRGLVKLALQEGGEDHVIFAPSAPECAVGSTVWLGLRPEELTISIKPGRKTDNQLEGKVIDYGFLGQKIVYYIELDTGKILHVSVPTSEKMRDPKLVSGRRAFVSWSYGDGVILRS